MKIKIYILILSCFLVACGSKKGIVTKKKKSVIKTEEIVTPEKLEPVISSKTEEVKTSILKPRSTVVEYIEAFSEIAMQEMRASKIPASITLAQGILESGSGNGRLAKEANNHFGIKCHGWTGDKIYHDDDASQECFRKYKAAESSYEDHSKFLTGRKRYSKLFQLKATNYKGWANGLKAAGYATDRKYPQKLISLIERYKLYNYDREVLGKAKIVKEIKIEEVENHTVIKGDTLYSLSRRYGVSVTKIKVLNNLDSNDLVIGQVLVIKSI